MKINKQCGWKKVFLNVLDKDYKLNKKLLLDFKNRESFYNFESNDTFFYLENDNGYKTEIVIISKNTEEITLRYNYKKKRYYISIVDTNHYFQNAISVVLRDEKNLFFREDKSKKIDIIIPKNYDKNKKYGLLLMFDGQNLFDKENSGNYTDKNDPYGSWQIDVSMSMLNKTLGMEYIVAGIEHTDYLRTNELITPTSFGRLKEEGLINDEEKIGYIDHLDDFINQTLLPFLTSNYSIDLNNLGISGSSMGGLGCHYIGIKNLGKYKFILSYTPASALIIDEAWDAFYKQLKFSENVEKLPLFYFFQGKNDELEQLLYYGNLNLTNQLIKNGYPKELIKTYIEESAMHNEIAWRYAFNYMIYDTFKKRAL